MKNNDMMSLLNLAYEIEGLLMLHINRGEESAPEMKDLLIRKAQSLLDGLMEQSVSEVAAAAPEVAPVDEPEPAVPELSKETGMQVETVAACGADSAESAPEATGTENLEVESTAKEEQIYKGLTLDEKLARERAADISKAFTINDKFRFCRDLFRNSEEEFRETLGVIGSMADMDEAEDYFYNDLCWDPEKDEVKEFMSIVAKHF